MKTNRAVLTLAFCALFPLWGIASTLPDTQSRDAQVLTQAQQKLAHAKIGDKVALKVEDGTATLSGTVDSVAAKDKASKEIMKVPGITSVINNLQIAAAEGGDDKLLGRVVHEIRMYPYYTVFSNIEASADGGRVKLSGQVVQPWEKSDIGRIIAAIPGVKEVENDLEVLPLSPYDDQLRWRIASAIYRDPLLLKYSNMALPPIHIVVKNGNVTLVGYVHDQVEKAAAFRDARFAATYFDLTNQLVVETAEAKAKR